MGRYLAKSKACLVDRSSRPDVSPRLIAPATVLTIIELRKKRITQLRIAGYLNMSRATVSRVLKRASLPRLSNLDPVESIVGFDHAQFGELIHLDTKKLARI